MDITSYLLGKKAGGGGGGGTSDYSALTNKPSINTVTLSGDKTASDLSLLGTSDIATTISSSSGNTKAAGAKAVYDYVATVVGNAINASY